MKTENLCSFPRPLAVHFACLGDTWPLSDDNFPPSSGYRSL